ncbi:MAG: PD-(D/E)XK nuclease family protein, partial [Planctomycetes bacterium]|nr:PD-(D/E)XK nuclease family protein [Planctomycetota bacterium]
INASRASLLECLGPWLDVAARDATRTGAEWSAALMDWLTRVEVGQALRGWAGDAEAGGDLDQADEHRQVWRDVVSLLDDLAYALSDSTMTVRELGEVLDSGLSGLTLGLVPPTVDQVLVGSIERSRHPDIKAAVILGFNDGVFPQRFVEDSILNDDDRERLRSGGIPVGPPARERVLDESLLVYIALTRASERVVVTFATTDDAGQELRASPYLDAIRLACGGLDVERLGDPNREREAWDLLGPRDLRRRLAEEFRSRPTLAEDDGPTRRMWNGLYEHVRQGLEQDATTRRAFSSLAPQPAARLSVSSVDRLFSRPLRTSVSQLETYAACPFQHFGRYVLRLRERQEAALAPVDVGQIHHAVLGDFVGRLRAGRQGLTGLGDEELHRGLIESCDRVSTRLFQGGAVSHGRDAYVLRRAAGRIARVIRAQGRIALAGKARPHASEVPYGFDRSGGMPAFEVSTPSGERVLLRGFIDRVDLIELADELLGVVVDYKETRVEKRLDLSRVYHGLSLQLPAYLIALAEGGETLAGRPIRPIAALYVSLAPRYHAVAHPDQPESRDVGLGGTYRPRGMLRGDALAALDADHTTGWSQHYAAFLSKDGGLGHVDKSDAATPRDFDATLAHTRDKLGQLAGGILDGDVAVNPYRLGNQSPCSWCALGSVCRFEMGISQVRFLDSLKRSQVFARLTQGIA